MSAPGSTVRESSTVATAEDMRSLGVRIGSGARPGDLVVLTGPLGAGKTVVAQGIGAGLGVAGPVTSPTFVVARIHRDGRLPMVHVDAYRLGGVAEVDDLDLDTLTEESVTVVEWGGGLVERLSDSHLRVDIARRDDDVREVVVEGVGPRWTAEEVAVIAGRDGAASA
ncbi:MAG TPA: tRNA (adenosine(37)-N6)-threonylcarbamoyltransferase complex ATPase subunit type 1 TsaE [Mycobacteriales bacterium]|nr:tRNA (adenosine(37)-N6)-threonylcarbamoyltransferase complex ATPase subunit type 1 TsaE [Mycobacteriales bacterium]